MASATVNISPKTFSPTVLIHRNDHSGLINMCKRGNPHMLLSRKSLATSPQHVNLDPRSISETGQVEFEPRNAESEPKEQTSERTKPDMETLAIRKDSHVNRKRLYDQRFATKDDSKVWNGHQMISQINPPLMKGLKRCCKCCCTDFSDSGIPPPKHACDYRTILPHIFGINDENYHDKPNSDSLRWTLYNSNIVNKNILNLSCNGATQLMGPILSNRWIYPPPYLLKEKIIDHSKESTKSVPNCNVSSITSSCLTRHLPIAIGNTFYDACDSTNSNHILWPLLPRNSTFLPTLPCTNSLSFTIPSSSSPPLSSSSSPSTSPSSSSSPMSSLCLFRRESFISYDRKPILYDDIGSSGLQTKLNRNLTEEDDFTSPNKRSKFSDEFISNPHDHRGVHFVNSVTSSDGIKQNGAGTAKTTSIYNVPKDSVNDKRQIQKTKNFHCPFCNISCSNRGQLQGHVRIHTGERPFICQEPQCGKAFIRNEELTRHRRIHTGERPHICSICKKAFTRKDHLNKHMKTHS